MIELQNAVETKDIVSGLLERGMMQRTIAQATGATERTVRNWRRTSAIFPIYEERLRELQEIVLELEDVLTPKGIDQWLRARHRLLGGERAAELIAAGRAKKVLAAAKSYAEGVYL